MAEKKYRIKPHEFVVRPGDPFEGDTLDREFYVKRLYELVRDTEGSVTIGIDGGWGTGKTTLLKMFQEYCKSQATEESPAPFVVYCNAWENDFSDDALLPLMASIESQISPSATPCDSTIKTAWEAVKEKFPNIGVYAKSVAYGAVSAATVGIVDGHEMEQSRKDSISRYVELKNSINAFKESLQRFAGDIISKQGSFIVMVDELDRCKPSFAVKTLEIAKHVFNIDNLTLVLAINREQLGHAIKTVYGAGFDSDEYLRRFIDIRFDVSNCSKKIFTENLLGRYSERWKNHDGLGDLPFAMQVWFDFVGLSPRDQEQAAGIISMVLSANNKRWSPPDLIAFMVSVKMKYPDMYKAWFDDRAYAREVLKWVLNRFAVRLPNELRNAYELLVHLPFCLPEEVRDYVLSDLEKGSSLPDHNSIWCNISLLESSAIDELRRRIDIVKGSTRTKHYDRRLFDRIEMCELLQNYY